jgi:transglutaminase-like putative cysteine protease
MSFLALRSLHNLILVVFLLIFFLPGSQNTASAQGRGFSIDKKEPSWIVKIDKKNVRPKEKDISDGYYLSLYENQNHAELEEDYTHIIREIVSDAGVQNASQVSVTYEPGFQKLVFHKILIWRGNQAVDQLKAGRFKVLQNEKDLSKFIYSATYDAFLILDDVRKGDRIEYAYTIKGSNPIFGKKHVSMYYVEGSSTLGHLYMNLITDKNRKLNLKGFNKAEAPKITERDGYRLYEWTSTLTKTYRTTDHEPSWYNPLKRTQVTEYNNWNEVVNWGLSVNDYPNLTSPLLDKKIQEFKKQAAGNEKKYIELATRFVQDEIRYMGIEMGMYSHRPNSPEKVLKQRYGDCKDKSLLLVHLLKGINITAYMVYADTDLTLATKEYLPSPFVFNHVIVAIDYDRRRTWVDPTMSYQRGKFNDFYAPDYGYVLVIKPGNNALERLISKPKGKLVAELAFNVADTADTKNSTLVIHSKYSGNYADNIRSEIAESGTDGLEKDFLEYYGKYYTDTESSSPLEIKDDEKNNIVEITESYEIPNIWVRGEKDNQQSVNFYADLIINELRKVSPKKRQEPVALKHPVNIEQNITVYMPYMYDKGSEVMKVDNAQYSFELDRKNETNTATFNYKYKSLTAHMNADQIKAYNKDYKKVDENLSYYFMAKGVSSVGEPLDLNRYAVLGSLLTLIISGLLFMRVYQQRSPFSVDKIDQAKNIGGWLILLGIYLVFTMIGIFFSPIQSDIFENKLWAQVAETGKLKPVFIVLVSIDLIAITALFSYSILCCLLFFNKRESFPKHYINFCIADIVISVFNFLVFRLANITSDVYSNLSEQIIYLLVSIAICLAWIWYIKNSSKVKETFVFTYPESEWTKAMIQYYNRKLTASAIPEATMKSASADTDPEADKNKDQNENI